MVNGNGATEWHWAPQHDNVPCHTTRTALDLLGEHNKKPKILILPSNLPDLNLIQHLLNMPESIRIIGPKDPIQMSQCERHHRTRLEVS